jgi:hypothetical protein
VPGGFGVVDQSEIAKRRKKLRRAEREREQGLRDPLGYIK